MLVLMWASPCDANFAAGGGGGRGRAVSPPPPILLYITSRIAHMEYLFCWQLILIFLCFKLGVQTKHALAWMFFCTLATAFSTSHCMKTVCSSTYQWCMPTQPWTQSDWLEKKADQLLCLREEALGTRLMTTKTMVRCYVIGNA